MSGKYFHDKNHVATDWCRKNRLWRAFSRISSAGAEHPKLIDGLGTLAVGLNSDFLAGAPLKPGSAGTDNQLLDWII